MEADDINRLLDEAKPAEKTFSVCTRQDLVAEHEALAAEFEKARREPSTDSLSSGGKTRVLAEQLEALEAQMTASTIRLRLRVLPRKAFRKLVAQHPPRKDEVGNAHAEDSLGVNTQTFWDPLIRASIVAPQLDKDRLNRLLDEVLSDRQYEELASACWGLNRWEVDIPFSSAASRLRQSSTPE